jgi:hypothetical protein
MSNSILDNITTEVCTSSADGVQSMDNIINLSNHPLWQQREYNRLIAFLEGKPDSGWRHLLYEYGEKNGETACEWLREIHSCGPSPKRLLELAKDERART